jgi:hypothetical protein
MRWWRRLVLVSSAVMGLALALQAEDMSGGLPLISISTAEEKITKEEAISAKLLVHRKNLDGLLNAYSSPQPEQWYPIAIKRRGFSSNLFKKKQYQFKFLNAEHKTAALPMFDLPAGKKWVLNGPYVDRTQMRNALVYQWGRQMAESRSGAGWFAPHVRFVEVEMNGEYIGIYGLTERIERGKNRLQVKKIDIDHPEEMPHFIMKLESLRKGEKTRRHTLLNWVYPSKGDLKKWEEKKPENAAMIKRRVFNYIDAFEAVLKSDNFADPIDGYRPYIDVDSFVDYMIIQEVVKNTDAYRKSAYFHLGNDGKIHMGPLWDFDLALGNLFFYRQHTVDKWNFKRKHLYHGNRARFWFYTLMKDPYFAQKFYQRYQQLRHTVFDDAKIDHEIALYTNGFGNAAERNFAKWGKIRNPLFRFIMNRPPFPKGFGNNIELMKDFIHRRLAWIDTAIEEYSPRHSER